MPEKRSKLAQIKTKPTAGSVDDFLNAIQPEQKRSDSFVMMELMKDASGAEPKMWGSSIVGFGNMRYKSPTTGREVDWLQIGFSPRKANLAIYLLGGLKRHAEALEKLGKHKTGVGCLYVNKLDDIDLEVLRDMIDVSLKPGSVGE